MSSFILYLLLSYGALMIQAVFFHGAKPDMVVILVCIFTLKYGQARGVALGAVAGFIIDTVNGVILGPNIMSKAVVAFLTATIKDNLFQWNGYINAMVISALSVTDIFIIFISYEIFSKASFFSRSWEIALYQIIYTVLVSLFLYPLLTKSRKAHI